MTLDQIEGLKVRLQAPQSVLKPAALCQLRWLSGLALQILLHRRALQDLNRLVGGAAGPDHTVLDN